MDGLYWTETDTASPDRRLKRAEERERRILNTFARRELGSATSLSNFKKTHFVEFLFFDPKNSRGLDLFCAALGRFAHDCFIQIASSLSDQTHSSPASTRRSFISALNFKC